MHFHTRCSIYCERVRQAQFSSPFAFIYQCTAHLNNLNSAHTLDVFFFSFLFFGDWNIYWTRCCGCACAYSVQLSSLAMCTILSIAVFFITLLLLLKLGVPYINIGLRSLIFIMYISILLFNCHNYGETIAVAVVFSFVKFCSLFVSLFLLWNHMKSAQDRKCKCIFCMAVMKICYSFKFAP